ncbi:MAG: hypothetical protein R3E66_12590 [bacterium]
MKRLGLMLLLAGCQAVTLGDSGAQKPTPQPLAARVLIGAEGLTRIYEVEAPDGFALDAAVRVVPATSSQWEIGPVSTTIPVASRTGAFDVDRFRVTNEFRNVSLVVPVRVRTAEDLEICRFQVQMASATLDSAVEATIDTGVVLAASGQPAATTSAATVTKVGPCAVDGTARSSSSQTLASLIETYTRDALLASGAQNLTVRPFEVTGILDDSVSLRRVSVFDNRRGGFAVTQRSNNVTLASDGLSAELGIGMIAQRATCAPPIEVNPAQPSATEPISPAELEAANADLALAVSAPTLQQMAETLALSGFLCQGLEDSRRPEDNAELIAVDDIGLDALGLDWLSVGPWVRASSAPGALPSLILRPQTNDFVISWRDFVIDVYADVQGTNVRILRLVTTAQATLRPQVGEVGQISTTIDALNITSADLTSDWLTAPLGPDIVLPWAKRAVLLFLQDQFVFPLPLVSPHAMRVRNVTVRDQDVAVFLDIEN